MPETAAVRIMRDSTPGRRKSCPEWCLQRPRPRKTPDPKTKKDTATSGRGVCDSLIGSIPELEIVVASCQFLGGFLDDGLVIGGKLRDIVVKLLPVGEFEVAGISFERN